MSVDPLDNTWSAKEEEAWREKFFPILADMFPKFRVFPRSMLTWLTNYNIYYCIYVIFKWTSITPWHESWAGSLATGSIECKISVFVNVSTLAGQTVTTTLICLSLFLIVVMHVDLETKKAHLSFLFISTFVPFSLAIAALLGFGPAGIDETCKVNKLGSFITRGGPYLIAFGLQVVFLVSTMRYINNVVSSIKNNTTNSLPTKYIYIRFIATFLSQTYNLLPYQISLIFKETQESAIFDRFANVCHTTGPMLDSIVMILGNTEFMAWANLKIDNFVSFMRDNRNNNNNNDKPKSDINTEMQVVNKL